MPWVFGVVGAMGTAMGAVGGLAGCTSTSGDPGDASPPADASEDRITVMIYPCPTIVALSAAPSAIDRDGSAAVTVQTVVPEGGMLLWTASSGNFADASATDTTYSCAMPGTATLTATVSYQLCMDSEKVMVKCL